VVAAWRRGLPHHTFTGVFIGILLAELGMAALGRADVLPLALGVVGAAVGFAAVQGALPAAYRGYGLGIGLALAAQGAGALAVLGMVGAGLLPAAATVSEIYPALFITRKGFVFPEIRFDGGFAIVLPQKPRFQFISGATYTPELMALLVGLVIYTSAFIGEIVRAGIQAVPYGQIEASRALGFSGWQTLRLIVLPQALRVIIPPLSNQYLNLAKNSTLATAVAFSDAYSVGQTIMNQSGQSVTGFFIILITYLTMSLIIATIMNIVNRRFQLVTR
jgi:ABC-type amino acid transport system permease subunit